MCSTMRNLFIYMQEMKENLLACILYFMTFAAKCVCIKNLFPDEEES